MITTSRLLALATAALLLAGCAEKNFVPGSPLAQLNGYNRSYEEIAASDCQSKFGIAPGSPQMQQCIYEMSMNHRQVDANYQGAANNLGAVGVGLIDASQPQPIQRPLTCTQQGIYTNCF